MIWRILIPVVLVALVMSAGLYYLVDYLALNKPDQFANSIKPRAQQNNSLPSSNSETNLAVESVRLKREVVAENLSVPWSIVWTSAQRMLVSERGGAIRAVVNDDLEAKPLITFPEVTVGGEQGLMGLAVDPNYLQNKYLYVARAERSGSGYKVDILRLVDEGTSIRRDKVLIPNVPAGFNHAGSRVKFGPDGKLYVTSGDVQQKSLAQEQGSLAGKVLRYNPDGTIPDDNPFPNSPIWSVGHRNPQGIDWHPDTGDLWETEHGPSGNDGPGGGDEVNLITKGGNFGWPLVSHERNQTGLSSPKQLFTPAVAPASLVFYNAERIPQFKNNLFFGALRGEGVIRLQLNNKDQTKIETYEKVELANGLGRIRDVAVGPDGALYFSSSNKDGRGRVQSNDDKVYRLIPDTN